MATPECILQVVLPGGQPEEHNSGEVVYRGFSLPKNLKGYEFLPVGIARTCSWQVCHDTCEYNFYSPEISQTLQGRSFPWALAGEGGVEVDDCFFPGGLSLALAGLIRA
jgi:hypothetical protein